MSGLGKKGAARDGQSVEELEAQYAQTVDGIRKILNGRKDKRDLSGEDKQKLRTEYLRASQLAQKLSTRHTDNEKTEKYRADAKKLSDRAAEYGSAITGKIPDTTFEDVKGLEEVKKIVKSFIFIAQNPDIIEYYKIEGGLGMLMYGAPGTGKTMFAEAIANSLK